MFGFAYTRYKYLLKDKKGIEGRGGEGERREGEKRKRGEGGGKEEEERRRREGSEEDIERVRASDKFKGARSNN